MEYQNRWYFVPDKNYKQPPIVNVSACRAHIVVDGKTITDYAVLTIGTKQKQTPFVQFLRNLADKIIDATFQTSDDATRDDLKAEAHKELPEQKSNQVANKFFKNTIPTLVRRSLQDLADSYLEFNTTDSPQSNNQKEGDANMSIAEAIEKSAKGKKCVVFTGAPGTGKTYCVEEYVDKAMQALEEPKRLQRSEYFVQFHSSYDYTDFVEGLRPIQDGKGDMIFRRMDGIFKAFCKRVVQLNGDENPPKKTYYFVIDEINRADLGRVFGELMYCFEKRGEKHKIATQYANLDAYGKDGTRIKDDCFKDGFYIPENVVIIGTMNDIDRSVETFDFALRRRFDWIEIKADKVMESSLKSMVEKSFMDMIESWPTPIDVQNKPESLSKMERTLMGRMEPLLSQPNSDEAKKAISKEVSAIAGKIAEAIAERVEPMNAMFDGKQQSGLGKEFMIGPAYFKPEYFEGYDVSEEPTDPDEKDAFNKKNEAALQKALDDIWDHNIESILKEYVRGRQKGDTFVEACRKKLLEKENGGGSGEDNQE